MKHLPQIKSHAKAFNTLIVSFIHSLHTASHLFSLIKKRIFVFFYIYTKNVKKSFIKIRAQN